MLNVLIIPGRGNSGPEHWQTQWEKSNSDFKRVDQKEWLRPVCSDWVENLEQAVLRSGPHTILVAHSLGCLLVAHWSARYRTPIHGALLVAPPDPNRPDYPSDAIGFAPVPQQILPFPSIVVASSNDPFGTAAYAQTCAASWGSRFINIGPKGHINAASDLGDWPEGFKLLSSLF